MNTPPIIVVGTPQGFWTQWVRQTLARLQPAHLHADLPSSEALGAALDARAEARALVLVEHPATGLARMLTDGGAVDPRAWLDEWLASGRALLAHAQRHSDECLLVNADDVRRNPERIAHLLRARWGESFIPPAGDPPAMRVDVLADALAWGFVDRNLAVQDVADELLASCAVMPGDRSTVPAMVGRGGGDGAAVAQRMAGLLDAERSLECMKRDLALAQARIEERDQELLEMHARFDAADRDRSALAAQLDEASGLRSVMEQELESVRSRLVRSEDLRVGIEASLRIALHEEKQQQQRLRQAEQELGEATRGRRDAELRLANAAEAARLEGETLRSELDTAKQYVFELGEQLGEVQVRLCETEAALVAAREEIEPLRQQVLQVKQELDTKLLAHRDAEAQFDEATKRYKAAQRDANEQEKRAEELARKLSAEQARANERASELNFARDEADLLLQQLHRLQEELMNMALARRDAEALAAETKTLEQELRNARDECDLMGLQMNQVQQELEHVHQQKLTLEHDANARIPLPGMGGLSIGAVEAVGERDTPPHREVSFIMRDLRAGSRHVAQASVRLVEHWGRPGLVVFAADSGATLFEAWHESGREDGRPYMLFVHGEEATQRMLDAMGTFDWQLIQALAVRVHQALERPGMDVSPVWRSLAQRLLTSLQETPARLRHEDVRVMPIAQESPEVARWGLVLEHASYRGRIWPRLTIQWRSSGPRPSIELVRDEDSGPPLLTWPADADGLAVRALRLPIGDDPLAPEIRSAWDVLVGADRAFVAEILNLLPNLAVHVQASIAHVGRPPGLVDDLQAAAHAAVLFGRSALQPSPAAVHRVGGRRLLQRVAGRLRRTVFPEAGPAVVADPTR
jgi:hypothetical protein